MVSFEKERGSRVEDITKNSIKRFRESEIFDKYCEEEVRDLVNMILEARGLKVEGEKLTFDTFVHSLTVYLNSLGAKDAKSIKEGLEILKKLLEFTRASETNSKENLKKLMEVDIVQTLFTLF